VKIPRVLILQKNSLLSHALTSILHGPETRQFTTVTSAARDFQALVSDISELDPDYVLLEESTFMASTNALIDLLKTYPGMRVMIISEDSNLLHIYQNRNVLLTQPEDLLKELAPVE
jgi:DNA-binding NarL/FixJ family response regulator